MVNKASHRRRYSIVDAKKPAHSPNALSTFLLRWGLIRRRLCRAHAEMAAHACAAQPAIAGRVLGKVLLVVILSKVERRGVDNLGCDGVKARALERLLIHRFGGLGRFAL